MDVRKKKGGFKKKKEDKGTTWQALWYNRINSTTDYSVAKDEHKETPLHKNEFSENWKRTAGRRPPKAVTCCTVCFFFLFLSFFSVRWFVQTHSAELAFTRDSSDPPPAPHSDQNGGNNWQRASAQTGIGCKWRLLRWGDYKRGEKEKNPVARCDFHWCNCWLLVSVEVSGASLSYGPSVRLLVAFRRATQTTKSYAFHLFLHLFARTTITFYFVSVFVLFFLIYYCTLVISGEKAEFHCQ